MAKSIWKGSSYKRTGKLTGRFNGAVTWRDRYTGAIHVGGPKGRVIGYEKTRASPYGINPRSKQQASKDVKSFLRRR